jgi:hypothetical protein
MASRGRLTSASLQPVRRNAAIHRCSGRQRRLGSQRRTEIDRLQTASRFRPRHMYNDLRILYLKCICFPHPWPAHHTIPFLSAHASSSHLQLRCTLNGSSSRVQSRTPYVQLVNQALWHMRLGSPQPSKSARSAYTFFSPNAPAEPRANGEAVCSSGAQRARTPAGC